MASLHDAPLAVPPALEERLKTFGQQHTLDWLKRGLLSSDEASKLVSQLSELDLQRVADAYASTQSADAAVSSAAAGPTIEPPDPAFCEALDAVSQEDRQRFDALGRAEIAAGRAAVIILGGGQGTRLGFDGPKGLYNIALPSSKSLFQLYAERIVRLQQLVAEGSNKKVAVPLFVMTSPLNHDTTREFFEQRDFFGLDAQHVHFFRQGTLPALTDSTSPSGGGKIIMQSGHQLSEAPDGNGGIYNALEVTGVLAALEASQVHSVHVFSVDNAVCKVADPVFLGFCLSRCAEVGNKVVWKTSPGEKVGVVARRDGRTAIVEYSELSEELATQTDPSTGKLAFGAGNICNHYFTVPFLRKVATAYRDEPAVMPYHVAKKKIPSADAATGATLPMPDTPNGVKLEAFIFDSFPLAAKSAILEVRREEEFSPLKKAPGPGSIDSPDTARGMIMSLHRNWAEAAGARFSSSDAAIGSFEISPLVSYGGEDLESSVGGQVLSPTADAPVHITERR
jgi:UDP-N-acetylglucosamine/UDP-N-acetylgalactosamine diphosphorylase